MTVIDQRLMRIFRQFAAFGAQSLYAYLLHVALLILVERLGFFDLRRGEFS